MFACFSQMTELCVSCSAAVKKHKLLEAYGEGTWHVHTHSAGLCPHFGAKWLLKNPISFELHSFNIGRKECVFETQSNSFI